MPISAEKNRKIRKMEKTKILIKKNHITVFCIVAKSNILMIFQYCTQKHNSNY